MNAKPNYNDWHINVYPKSAGDFGFGSISSVEYTENEAKILQSDMQDSISRHTDEVRHTSVEYDSWLCGECGNAQSTKEQANECCERIKEQL